MGLAQGLTLPGSLDHKLSNLLLDPSLATFRAFYRALFVFAYGHYECEDLFAVEALILICRHSHLPARAHHGQSILLPNLKLFYKDYSELRIVMSTNIGMLQFMKHPGYPDKNFSRFAGGSLSRNRILPVSSTRIITGMAETE